MYLRRSPLPLQLSTPGDRGAAWRHHAAEARAGPRMASRGDHRVVPAAPRSIGPPRTMKQTASCGRSGKGRGGGVRSSGRLSAARSASTMPTCLSRCQSRSASPYLGWSCKSHFRVSQRRRRVGRCDGRSGTPAFARRRVRATACARADLRRCFHSPGGLSARSGWPPLVAACGEDRVRGRHLLRRERRAVGERVCVRCA